MAVGDIVSVELHSLRYGSYADIRIEGLDTGGTYNFGDPTSIETANLVVVVTSEGFDSSGNPILVTRTLFGTTRGRRPHPNNSQAEETKIGDDVIIRCWLSGYVYDDDKAGGPGTSGVNPVAYIRSGLYTYGGTPNNEERDGIECTNSSTLDYPKALCRWAWPGWERVVSTYDLETVCAHAEGRDGKPVACVKYTALDESFNTAEYVVSVPSPSKPISTLAANSRGANDANCIEVYRATLSAAPFASGQTIIVQARAYPLVGDADSVADSDAVSSISVKFHNIELLCDKSESWGIVYAVVDSVSGNNATAVASENLATATASPYLTIAAAADGIRARYNAWKGRNSSSGGVIYLRGNASHTWIGATRTAENLGPNYKTWLTVETYPGDDMAVISGYSSTGTRSMNVALLRLRNIYVNPSGTGSELVIFAGSIAAGHVLWVDQCKINWKNTVQTIFWSYFSSYVTHSEFENGTYLYDSGGLNFSFPLIRGCQGADTDTLGYAHSYCFIGNTYSRIVLGDGGAGVPIPDNSIIAWNRGYRLNNVCVSRITSAAKSLSAGLAVVGNVFEGQTNAAGLIHLQGQGLGDMPQVVFCHNTIPGESVFFAQLDSGTENTINTRGAVRGNVLFSLNCKTDTLGADPNGARVNNWSQVNGVGHAYGCYGSCTFPPEYIGVGSLQSQSLAFQNDQSGGGSGLGDYRPAANAVFRDYMPAELRVMNYDLLGQALKTSGNIDAGAIQFGDAAASVTPRAVYIVRRKPRRKAPAR